MHLLPFARFLTEKFYKGLPGFNHGDMAEIYVDPTPDELRSIGPNEQEIGAILDGTKLYAWNREHANHKMVMYQVHPSPNWLPLYLYYDGRGKSLHVKVSNYTLIELGRKKLRLADATKILTPVMKKYGRMSVDVSDDDMM